jgi:pantoate--beta-alanine ligase
MTDILRDLPALRGRIARWRANGKTVGVVPTMGALHQGHLSLALAAKAACDRVIVTIFVNPTQFNNADDLKKYPRTEESDAALLASIGVDVIFAPPVEVVYPAGFATKISVTGVSGPLEGTHRPGHFEGVATVVAKLFGMTTPDKAFFGQKDWQQLAVIRRMTADLNIPVQIVPCETLRDPDGLAMSSRNARLSELARSKAPALYFAMTRAARAIAAGEPAENALEVARVEVLEAGFTAIDYLDLCDAETLEPVQNVRKPARLLAAAWLDGVRLIDNIPAG